MASDETIAEYVRREAGIGRLKALPSRQDAGRRGAAPEPVDEVDHDLDRLPCRQQTLPPGFHQHHHRGPAARTVEGRDRRARHPPAVRSAAAYTTAATPPATRIADRRARHPDPPSPPSGNRRRQRQLAPSRARHAAPLRTRPRIAALVARAARRAVGPRHDGTADAGDAGGIGTRPAPRTCDGDARRAAPLLTAIVTGAGVAVLARRSVGRGRVRARAGGRIAHTGLVALVAGNTDHRVRAGADATLARVALRAGVGVIASGTVRFRGVAADPGAGIA